MLYPNSKLVSEALLMKGRTLYETKDYAPAVEALNHAEELGGGKYRAEVLHHLGLVRKEEGDVPGALVAFSEVVKRHRGSPWFGPSGLEAGDLERDRGNMAEAAACYEKVRSGAHTVELRYVGACARATALMKRGEYDRAQRTYADVAKNAANNDRRGRALLAQADAVAGGGDVPGAVVLYRKIVVEYPREEAAAEAQFAIAKLRDDSGDVVGAKQEYDLVKEQGTGHDAWQRATARITEIDKLIALREQVAKGGAERDSSRFLLAEHLLESVGDVDGALAEYSTLSEDAKGTELGAKALFAEAWVLENRSHRPEAADSALFRLANDYAGTEVDAYARKRLGYPVWKAERVAPPKVVFIRPESESAAPQQVLVERVEPKAVPLPPGVTQVDVWVRVHLARDGSVQGTKVVKSGGEAFDAACVEAAKASRFLGPDEGGPEVTVLQYSFPPPPPEAPKDAGSPGAPPAQGTAASGTVLTPNTSQAPPTLPDSTAVQQSASQPPPSLPDSTTVPPSQPPPNASAPPPDQSAPPDTSSPPPDQTAPPDTSVTPEAPRDAELFPSNGDRQVDRNP